MAISSPFLLKNCLFFSLFLTSFFFTVNGNERRSRQGSEEWGYVEVRSRAHMFWWLYRSPHRVDNGSSPWPTVLWLQGGPGASGVGIGNFEEIGPLDTNLKPRSSTWLHKADLLFVDNPVGTGYSYVDDNSLFVKTDWEAASDLTTLLKKLYNNNEALQKSPLYIVAESYGGKFAATLGLAIVKNIKAGKLKLQFGGVALGDSWISPEDFVFSWGPLLLDVSRLDKKDAEKSNIMAKNIKQELQNGQYENATNSWSELENFIITSSNGVDFYNFLSDSGGDPVSTSTLLMSRRLTQSRYRSYLANMASTSEGIGDLMNGVIRKKLKIIPENVTFDGQSGDVFSALAGDFMKPRISEVSKLLSYGVNVTIYNGQLDVICATKGTEAWVQKMKWKGLTNFNNLARKPLYCGNSRTTKGYLKSYKNLRFYWILGAGHFVPVDQPCIALHMIADITNSPASSL